MLLRAIFLLDTHVTPNAYAADIADIDHKKYIYIHSRSACGCFSLQHFRLRAYSGNGVLYISVSSNGFLFRATVRAAHVLPLVFSFSRKTCSSVDHIVEYICVVCIQCPVHVDQ